MKKPSPGGYLVAKVHNATEQLFAKKLKDFALTDLDPSLVTILYFLQQSDGCSIRDIADFSGFGKSTLSSMLDRLEQGKWIRRVHSKEDRRVIHIHLEKSLEEIHALFGPIDQEMAKAFYRGFTKAEIKVFEETLIRIMENLDAESAK